MTVYYNEFDPGAAAWLRELMKEGLIADGEVDERSILDVRPDDLRGFRQCHFFAGIGGWSLALRLAGIPDDFPVWTGSPPCQPFSAAGKQLGREDARHLAPHFISLVGASRPPVLFGEQVASSDVFGKATKRPGKGPAIAPQWAWLDDLSDRLEAAHYAVGADDLPAASIGAPHIRQRTFFGAVRLADSECGGWRRGEGAATGCVDNGADAGWVKSDNGAVCDGETGTVRLDHTDDQGRQHIQENAGSHGEGDRSRGQRIELGDRRIYGGMAYDRRHRRGEGREGVPAQERDGAFGDGPLSGMADQPQRGRGKERQDDRGEPFGDSAQGRPAGFSSSGLYLRPRPNYSPWASVDWLGCQDGLWRLVEPGTFPLAHGVPARVGRLRGYGNAIVPQVAAEFIVSFLAAIEEADL